LLPRITVACISCHFLLPPMLLSAVDV
jgi:hypothetical protein